MQNSYLQMGIAGGYRGQGGMQRGQEAAPDEVVQSWILAP